MLERVTSMPLRGIRAAGEGVSGLYEWIISYLRQEERLTTADVLAAEYRALWGTNDNFSTEQDYRRAVKARPQAALCLSGGGIRSAAFSLGVLQALAQMRLLSKFQYLSTVSGGGYIGAWLSRWINEENHDAATVEKELGDDPNGPPPETAQISALRRNSNYLTPQAGIASADTWTGIILWLRNVLLNWLLFIPALLIVAAFPNLYLAVMAAFYQRRADEIQITCTVTLVIAFVALFVATWQASRYLPSHQNKRELNSANVTWRIVLPTILWAALIPIVLVEARYPILGRYGNLRIFGWQESVSAWLFGVNFAAAVGGYVFSMLISHRIDKWLFIRNFPAWIIISLITSGALLFAINVTDKIGALLPGGNNLFSRYSVLENSDAAANVAVLCILGPLAVTLAHLLQTALYVGFRHTLFKDDADREWLGRLSAVVVFPTLLWALFSAVCVLLPWVIFENHAALGSWFNDSKKWIAGAVSVISGLIAVFGGKSATSKFDLIMSAAGSKPSIDIVIKIATSIFLIALFACLARAERGLAELAYVVGMLPIGQIFCMDCPSMLLTHIHPSSDTINASIISEVANYFSSAAGRYVLAHVAVIVMLYVLVWAMSKKIDVNRFSLHGMYRNRLVRTFLGAARRNSDPALWTRQPNPFTGFDPGDDVRMHELHATVSKKRVLFPVVNVTLNLASSENLEWQERKASSFVITPIACGSAMLDRRPKRPFQKVGHPERYAPDLPRQRAGAYTAADRYGGPELALRGRPDAKRLVPHSTGISLGSAMTISGAAVSPNQGYHSSASTAFLMTLFNVRLGAWMVNPARATIGDRKRSGPSDALSPLFVEALGLTSDESKNVYLSHGGHFDNLGLYEMIRRRCRFILVVDADADADFAFTDLGKAVRQVVIDLDADIDFETIAMRKPEDAKKASPTFATARIRYRNPEADGWLIYLKPTYYYETAPVDVRAYGSINKSFPHESTLDQWFSESQFESYRRLGYFLTSHLGRSSRGRRQPYRSVATFFRRVRHMESVARKRRRPRA
jgi:Patatin-like phospholipase